MEQTPVTVFKFNEAAIAFKAYDGTTMVNATQMAKTFNKRVTKWLELPSTQEFLQSLSEVRKSDITQLVIIRRGNFADKREQGTWMHEDVALEFARWLSPMFAIWCNDRIKEMLRNGSSSVSQVADNASLKKICELQAQNLYLYKELYTKNIASDKTAEMFVAAQQFMPDSVTTTDIAAIYGMTARQLNDKLEEAGIIVRNDENIYLSERFANTGIANSFIYSVDGVNKNSYLKWNKPGQIFLFLLIKYRYDTDSAWSFMDNGECIIKLPSKKR